MIEIAEAGSCSRNWCAEWQGVVTPGAPMSPRTGPRHPDGAGLLLRGPRPRGGVTAASPRSAGRPWERARAGPGYPPRRVGTVLGRAGGGNPLARALSLFLRPKNQVGLFLIHQENEETMKQATPKQPMPEAVLALLRRAADKLMAAEPKGNK